MLALARTGADEGLWLRADRQTAGRGRSGRQWESGAGNLYCSTLVRLCPGDPPASDLALVAALAAWDVVSQHVAAADVTIKWPNDLLVGGAKLGGILLERQDNHVVAGFGINLTHAPAIGGRATACIADFGPAPSADGVMDALADALARWLVRWRTGGLDAIGGEWMARAHAVGTLMTAHLPDGTALEGRFGGLARDGALILNLADGEQHVMHAGDVFTL